MTTKFAVYKKQRFYLIVINAMATFYMLPFHSVQSGSNERDRNAKALLIIHRINEGIFLQSAEYIHDQHSVASEVLNQESFF